MKEYVGLLDGSGDVWGVRIPDAPGVHGGGATPEEAIADATSALREIGALRATDGRAPFKARTLAEVRADPKVIEDIAASGGATVVIPLPTDM